MAMYNKPLIRMSNAGSCPRALSAQLLGIPADPEPQWLKMVADEGHWHEKRIKEQLRAEGLTVLDEQLEVSLDYPEFTLVGHIDGHIILPDNTIAILEIKSMSQYEFDRWMRNGFEAFPRYAAQLACYMEATDNPVAYYVVKNRNTGYLDRRIIKDEPCDIDDILTKLTLAVRATDPLEIEIFNDSECKRCLYRNTLCIKDKDELTVALDQELFEAAKKWRQGSALIQQGEVLVAEARQIFEEHSAASGLSKWQFDGLIIHYNQVRRSTYDKKELLKLFSPEQLAPALKQVEYKQLRIEDTREI